MTKGTYKVVSNLLETSPHHRLGIEKNERANEDGGGRRLAKANGEMLKSAISKTSSIEQHNPNTIDIYYLFLL